MALPFESDVTISSNPFLDILMRNLKVLTYNCIIKDEYEANRKETPKAFKMAELYMSCIENNVTLAMFSEAGISIPDNILYSVFDVSNPKEADIVKLYKNFGNSIEWIPKDIESDTVSEDSRYSQTNYRYQLLSKLRVWFLQTYEEQNEYYRMICGLPALKSWGIPIKDYWQYLPEYIREGYKGDFIHELDVKIINELNSLGVLDIVRMEYPDEKYLIYLPATLDLYEVRKKADMHILWLPSDVINEDIKRDFESKYNERRDFMIKTVYTSAMEIESEYYHSLMIIYLLVTTMLDIMAELQQHIIKKDIMDRRCVEYLFSQQGVTYYKNIPYKYQEKLCANLHNLVKYKSCTKNILTIKSLFEFKDVELQIYKYYLMKIRKFNTNGDFVIEGDNAVVTEPNGVIEYYTEDDDLEEYTEEVTGTFHVSDENDVLEDRQYLCYRREVPYPYTNYEKKNCIFFININGILLQESKDYLVERDENDKYNQFVKIKKNIIDNAQNISYEFYVDEIVSNNTNSSSNNTDSIKVNTIYVHNYSNSHEISLTDVFSFSYNYLALPDKLWVVINNYWLSKTNEIDTIRIKNIENHEYYIGQNISAANFDLSTDKVKIEIFRTFLNIFYIAQKIYDDNNVLLDINLYRIRKNFTALNNYEILNYSKTNNFIVQDTDNKYWIIPGDVRDRSFGGYYIIDHIPDSENYNLLKIDNGIEKDYLIISLDDNGYYQIKIEDEYDSENYQTYYPTQLISEDIAIDSDIFLVIGNYWFIRNTAKETETFQLNQVNDTDYSITRNNSITKDLSLEDLSIETNEYYLINKYTNEFKIILDESTSRHHILKIDDEINLTNKDMYIVFFDSEETDIRFCKYDIDINNFNRYRIPQPFSYYIYNNNQFYITITTITVTQDGSLNKTSEFINSSNYRILADDNDNTEYQLEFTNSDIIDNLKLKPSELKPNTVYHKIGFNYIYTSDSIINDFVLNTKEISFLPQYHRQIEFPIKSYLAQYNIDNIYSIYMHYNNQWLNPNFDFSYTNSNIIVDDSILINDINDDPNKDQTITLLIKYSDKNKDDLRYNNITIYKQFFVINSLNAENIFTLKLPVENYFRYSSNKLIVDVMGEILIENTDYRLTTSNEGTTLTIFMSNKITTNAVINVTYIYNKTGKYKISPILNQFEVNRISTGNYIINKINDIDNNGSIELSSEASHIKFNYYNKNNRRILDLDSIKSTNSFNLIIGNRFINLSNITLSEEHDYDINIIRSQSLTVQSLFYILAQNYINDKVMINMINYSIITKSSENTSTKDQETGIIHRIIPLVLHNDDNYDLKSAIPIEKLIKNYTDKLDSTDKNYKFVLPVNYFDNQWPYFITYKYNELTKLLPSEYYDIIDGRFYENEVLPELSEINELLFNFIYTFKPNYLYNTYLEEFDKNIELEFCKVPISQDTNLTEYLSDRNNWKDYDSVVNTDNWWGGTKYKNNYLESLKQQIYQSKFNIIKTKYYSLSQEEDFNKYAVQASIFYSMLYDNNFSFLVEGIEYDESDMQLDIQPISYYHKFLVSHLFLYMICLSYIYNNQDLPVIEHPNEINNIRTIGFNFNTNKEEIEKTLKEVYFQELVIDEKSTEHDVNLIAVLNSIDFGRNITSQSDIIHRFMEIYNTNKAAYDMICQNMLNTEDISEFRVWNYLYYELMTWKYNTAYFKLKNGTKLADTYEEFLKDQDGVLYNSLESIKNIYDTDTKVDTITSYLDYIKRALEDYLGDEEENGFLLDVYTGKFTNIIISYMKQMLDFFKSYKIYIKDLDTIISFDNGEENEENTYRIYEEILFNYTLNYSDYISLDEDIIIKKYQRSKIPDPNDPDQLIDEKKLVDIDAVRT